MSIEEQITAIKANNEQVLQKLYTGNFVLVKQFVLKNNGTEDDAKDIYQEAYISVWRNIQMDKFIPRHEEALKAYLFQIAKNKWLDHLRSSRYKSTTPLLTEHQDRMTLEEIDDTTLSKIKVIKNSFSQLGENCRQLLIRFYYKKETMKNIAEDLQWTEATAKNNKYRCMEKLRQLIK